MSENEVIYKDVSLIPKATGVDYRNKFRYLQNGFSISRTTSNKTLRLDL